MRALLAVLALAASTAVAQAPTDSLASDSLMLARPVPRAALILGGLAGSYLITTTVGALVGAVDGSPYGESSEWLTLLTLPAGAALGVIGVGALGDPPGSAGGAARGAAQGALIGYGVVLMAAYTVGRDFPFGTTDTEAFVVLSTLVTAVVLPSVLAARGYAATPVRVRAPDGTTAPGLVLRLAL